jgi:predicted RNA-binding protein associated with RNAse of E/G family
MTDLLADIVVYPDGRIRLLDLDELAEAHARGLIDSRTLERCLVRVNSLLDTIYKNHFRELIKPLEEITG